MKTETDRGTSAGQSRPREPLPEQVVELTARRLQVIAEPTRISLLETLNEGEAGVQELADKLGLPHQNVSQHLTRLHQAGFVDRRRSGTATLYAIADWTAWWVVEQIARWVQSCQDDQGASAPTE